MTVTRPRRSALYMPASNARAIEKAKTLACDVVILDLEDAVAPEAKAEARQLAVEAVRGGGFGGREVAIRINGRDTPWAAADLGAAAAAGADAVVVPKVGSSEDLAACAAQLSGKTRLWAMIETGAAIFQLDALGRASAANRTDVWIVGPNDLTKEMRCRPGAERGPLLPLLSLAVLAAHANGVDILDGVYNDIQDLEGLARECAQGVGLGMDGKTLIHPSQIEAANRAFTPDPGEVAWARAVAAAFAAPENAAKGVIKVEGKMVERLHLAEAERLIAIAEAIERREG
jgi:citrate lyase subunit beta/citryl-CoA lyase